MIDLHIHTARCRHARGTVDGYVEAVRAAGLETIAFTDHLPFGWSDDTDYAMSRDELPAYVEEVLAAAERSRSSGGPEVLLGIEADWEKGTAEYVAEAVSAFPFDVVLGSVHFIDGWAFDDPRLVSEYEGKDIDALWQRYFQEVAASAASGLFDVIAHPDLMKKFGHRPSGDLGAAYEMVAEAFARAGVAVEVNTAGLRKPCAEVYPAAEFLTACRRFGVPATVGSDAHRPQEVGAGGEAAIRALRDAGYDSVVSFRARQAQERAL